jgi:hypothetical protein
MQFLLGGSSMVIYKNAMNGKRKEASFRAVFAPDHERALYPGQMPNASH